MPIPLWSNNGVGYRGGRCYLASCGWERFNRNGQVLGYGKPGYRNTSFFAYGVVTFFIQKEVPMIIDCHGHYTTTPPQIEAYRNEQRALLAKDQNHIFSKGHVTISDDEIRDSIVNNQLKVQQDRGTDVTIFSPRASWMGQDLGNAVHQRRGRDL